MPLLDVNALVALAWDSHVHHQAIRSWFGENAKAGWETCPITETGFVRVSSNPRVLPHPIDVRSAVEVLAGIRKIGKHRLVTDGVSVTDSDFPRIHGYRQVTDAHLLAIARRHSLKLLTFDSGVETMTDRDEVILLSR